MSELENIKKISQSDNICFFPLRLETHFKYKGSKKYLSVRVIPDEILLDYHKNGLNSEEIEDGKKFWMQWYIASGSERREYDAWLNLCAKYPTSRAAWICRNTKLVEFDAYKTLGSKFENRPYPKISEIEAKCDNIYKILGFFSIDEDGISASTDAFEKSVEKLFYSIRDDLNTIDANLMIGSEIVDYLYDTIFGMVDYLGHRIEVFNGIYEKFSNLSNHAAFDQVFKKDIQALNDLTFRWSNFVDKFKDSRISLSVLVDKLKESMDKAGAFPKCNVLPKKYFEIPEPTMLPERFVFVGEAINANKKIENKIVKEFEKIVDRTIKLTIDPNSGSKYVGDSSTGKLTIDPSVEWLFDYDAACKAGMAMDVEIPNTVTGFNYIYVFGVKNNETNYDYLSDLFNGHNYLGSSLHLLNSRTSTNIVSGDVPVGDEDAEKRSRYKIEVDDGVRINLLINLPKSNNDAKNIAELLNSNYSACWSHIVNFDSSTEAKTKSIYTKLFDELRKEIKTEDDAFIRNFFINYVRASGRYSAIKVGNLPYGILPVSDFVKLRDALKKTKGANDKLCLLLDDLLWLKEKWDKLSETIPSPSTLKGVGSEKKYLEMAGQTPYSISFIKRTEIDSALIEKNVPEVGVSSSILNKVFKNNARAGQLIENTDVLFDIKTSKFVAALVKSGICDEADAVNYVTEFIDLFTYRLDAWFSGVLNYVLDSQNAIKTPAKTQIGAYGWLFDLSEKPSSSSNEGDDHFVVAPSIQHALSAAVLRSAYIKSKSSETDSHVCVNLSSMRARQALRLVDGIRSGMSMSVVLGCDLERYLHDAALHGDKENPAEMDRFIYPLRKLFPQLIDFDAEDSRAESYVMQVINGEALLETIINHEEWTWSCPVHEWLEEHFFDAKMAWLRDDELKMDDNQKNVFFNIVERLMDSYDALNDLLLSEGVHRLIMGDQASFTAIGQFLAEGEGGLPDPEILKTPSEHVVISHKAGMILPQPKEPSEKEVEKTKAFKLADSGVDAWVESLIGGMDKICFFVKFADSSSRECSLDDVGVSASEYLYLSAYPATFVNYLETRWCLKHKSEYSGKISILESAELAGISCPEGCLSLEEDSLRIQTIRNLLKNGHGMQSSDWNTCVQEDKADEDAVDKENLAKRCANLIAKAKKIASSMDDWINHNSIVECNTNDSDEEKLSFKGQFDNDQVDEAYGCLCDCIEFGLINCFTAFNPNAYMDQLDKVLQFKECEQSLIIQENLYDMVVSAKEDLENRINECEIIGLTKDEIKTSSSERIIETIQNLTLKNIKIFPKIKLMYDNLEIGTFEKNNKENTFSFKKSNVEFDSFIKAGLANYKKNIDDDSFDQWQDEVAEVREGMKNVHNLSILQTALDGKTLGASILQTTTIIVQNSQKEQTAELKGLNGYWLGMPVDDEGLLRDADSLVLYNAEDYQTKNSIAGFIFDGWLEYIPYKKHNAGLVFQCDKPDAEAPQSLLVAVNPNVDAKNSKWSLDSIMSIFKTTREMMKDRAVDPDRIYDDDVLSRMFPLFNDCSLN
ncbi:hypothetical protein [Fibrobacter sp. UWB11]|uniref:hypothetical protein n=1 Tax=Fibrobacter sp. UWB11 TaxID=1896202 RepID=UPI00092C4502|nr:hypothetical protein [Fibrobacter sp. UWB11]SIN96335.1 hypothetical protein SAMN05720758_0777 [Fibrobacter sp. UWB11]